MAQATEAAHFAAPRRRGVELVGGLLLVLFGFGFAVLALELGIRFLHLEPGRFWQADPLVGSVHIPGVSGWWTQEDREFVVPVKINREGWRDVERPVEKPAGTRRVLVLGDSFAEAMQVPLEDSFPRRLEAELNQMQSGPVEVINTGISGFGTAGELLLLQRDGPAYRPDVVLLALYPGNDVMNNSPDLETTLVPQYGADGKPTRVTSSRAERVPTSVAGKILARSKAYQYLRRRVVSGHPDLARRLGLTGGGAQAPAVASIPTAYFVYREPDATWQAAWDHTEQSILGIQSTAAAMGAKLAVAVIAGRDEVYPEWWAEVIETYPGMKGQTWDVDAPRRRIVEFCRSHGIPVLELTPLMREKRGDTPLHFHHDGHWTAAGHHLAAEAMANFLVKDGLLTKDREERPQ